MYTMSCGHFACRIKLATCVVCVTFLLYYRSLFDGIAILRTYRCGLLLYRPSSVVCVVCCLSVTLVSPAKTAAPIEMPFGLRTLVTAGNHALDAGPDHPMERGNFEGGKGHPIIKDRETVQKRLK